MRTLRLILLLAALPSFSIAAWAGDASAPPVELEPVDPEEACTDGLVFDDGGFENGYTLAPSERVAFAARFDSGQPVTLSTACLCFSRGRFTPSTDLPFDLLVMADTGRAGGPGEVLARRRFLARDVARFPARSLYRLPDLDIPVGASVHVGAEWSTLDQHNFSICADQTGDQKVPAFERGTDPGWLHVARRFGYSALGIRAIFEGETGAPCLPSVTAACLLRGRFRIEARWETAEDAGPGFPFRLTDDTGHFYFFVPRNIEVMVKMVDACSGDAGPPRFWVFASGTTNVEVELTVTDTETGASKTYRNPLGEPFRPILDTNAFPCS